MSDRRICDFCGQQAQMLFHGQERTTKICRACVEKFHEMIADGDLPTLSEDE